MDAVPRVWEIAYRARSRLKRREHLGFLLQLAEELGARSLPKLTKLLKPNQREASCQARMPLDRFQRQGGA